MSKTSRIAFTIFILMGVILGYWGYRSVKNNKQPAVRSLSLIPDSCDLLICLDDLSDFSSNLRFKNLLWQDLQSTAILKSMEADLRMFDSLAVIDPVLKELSTNNPIQIAFYGQSKYLIAFNVKELSGNEELKISLEKCKNALVIRGMNAEVENGAAGISNSPELLKKYFNRKKRSIENNIHFSDLKKATHYSGLSIFINKIKSTSVNTSVDKGEELRSSWTNVTIKPDRIVLNGLKSIDTSIFVGNVHAEPMKGIEFMKHIPLLSNSFELFAVNEAAKIFPKKNTNDWWNRANDSAMFNAKDQFYKCFSGELAKVLMPSKKNAIVVGIKDSAALAEILPFMKDPGWNDPDGIYKLNEGDFAKATFPLLSSNELDHVAVFADHLVFTSGADDARVFVNANNNGSSILENVRFRQFALKNFNTAYHHLSYKLLSALSKNEIPFGDKIEPDEMQHLKNLGHYSFTELNEKDLPAGGTKAGNLNVRMCFIYMQENMSDEPNVLWTMKLDTTIKTIPTIFRNHITGVNELILQAGKELCLLNATGKISWKKKLQEDIASDIFEVDAFNNKKFQMLFNTKNNLCLLDRNGNYVQGYPVKLPAAATNKLSLYDYGTKSDYRLFIACADHKIYNYSIYGDKQEGFKPLSVATDVHLPIKYCKVGASDYLVTADRKGKIYAFSRKGDGRIDFKNKLIEDAEEMEIVVGNSVFNTHILYYDKKGYLLDKISLNDVKEIYKIRDAENSPAICFFDLDKNSINDLVTIRGNLLEVYEPSGTVIFTTFLPEPLSASQVKCYTVGANTYISFFSEANSNCYIYNIEQKSLKQYKSSMNARIADLFNDGKPYALIVMNSELKCVKL